MTIQQDPTSDPTLKLDLIGSYLSYPLWDARRGRAVRIGDATGLNYDDPKPLRAVVNKFFDQEGYNYPQDDSDNVLLRLDTIHVVKVGPKAARLRANYRHVIQPQGVGGGWPDPFSVAEFRSSREHVQVYRTSADPADPNAVLIDEQGLPSGALIGTRNFDPCNPTPRPIPAKWPRRVVEMIVSTRLNFNPVTEIDLLQGAVNSLDVTVGNITFYAETMRFDGAHIEWQRSRFGDSFVVQYRFTLSATGHRYQDILYVDTSQDNPNPCPTTDGQWITVNALPGPAEDFTDAFPV
jgi:hypothetical protein